MTPAEPAAAAAAASREARLTKPAGALGRLEEIVSWLAYWQGENPPRLDRVEVLVFAGNHGVTARGVSAYPAEVTAQMVANFAAGGAAINQLARLAGAPDRLERVDRRVHLLEAAEHLRVRVVDRRVDHGVEGLADEHRH